MTCAIVPDFILKTFEKEIAKIVERVVVKMCDEYNIDFQDAKTRLHKSLDINLDIVNEDVEHVKIIKKHQPSTSGKDGIKELKNNDACEARIYIPNEIVVRQCCRSKLENGKFCKTHQKQYDSNTLKWGTIHDEKPEEISTAKLKLKQKKTLY